MNEGDLAIINNISLTIIIVAITITGSLLMLKKNKEDVNAKEIVEQMQEIYDGYADNYQTVDGLGSITVSIGELDLPEKTTYSDELDRSTAFKLAEDFSNVMGSHYKTWNINGVSEKEKLVIIADYLTVEIHYKQ